MDLIKFLIHHYLCMVPLKCNFTHMCVQTCALLRVMEHSSVSLTVYSCYTKGCTHVYTARVDTYIDMYTYAFHMLPTYSIHSLTKIVSQGTYSHDQIL